MSAAATSRDACLPDIVLELVHAPSNDALVATFRQYLDEMVLGPFAIAEIRHVSNDWRENLILGTVPDAFLEEYFASKSLFVSPLFRTAQLACKPMPLEKVYHEKLLSPRGRKVFIQIQKFGMNHGYCYPLKGRNNRPTLMLIAGDFKKINATERLILEMAVLTFYRRACVLNPESTTSYPNPQRILSDREREALSWVAKGKTDWEIAQLLEISERTVHYHIENAKKKMKVSTRLQAVVEAIRTLQILI